MAWEVSHANLETVLYEYCLQFKVEFTHFNDINPYENIDRVIVRNTLEHAHVWVKSCLPGDLLRQWKFIHTEGALVHKETDSNQNEMFILYIWSLNLYFIYSYLESAHNPVIINHIVVNVISSLSSKQIEGVEPVLKATKLTLQLFIVHLRWKDL